MVQLSLRLGSIPDVQLLQDLLHVLVYSGHGNSKVERDLSVRPSATEQGDNFELSLRQTVRRMGSRLPADREVREPAVVALIQRKCFDRRDHLCGGKILWEVAQGAGLTRGRDGVWVEGGRDHYHFDAGFLLVHQPPGRRETTRNVGWSSTMPRRINRAGRSDG